MASLGYIVNPRPAWPTCMILLQTAATFIFSFLVSVSPLSSKSILISIPLFNGCEVGGKTAVWENVQDV